MHEGMLSVEERWHMYILLTDLLECVGDVVPYSGFP